MKIPENIYEFGHCTLRYFHVQIIFTDIIAPSFSSVAISERDGRVGG